EEKKLYDEMFEMTKKIVAELTTTERTFYEQMRHIGQLPLLAAETLGGTVADIAGLPDGVGELGEKVAGYLREKNQEGIENNQRIGGGAANSGGWVRAEWGGVLPLYKKPRRQVYEYWERNNVERARDWMKKFTASLESEWITACPTYGQQDDAKDFYQ